MLANILAPDVPRDTAGALADELVLVAVGLGPGTVALGSGTLIATSSDIHACPGSKSSIIDTSNNPRHLLEVLAESTSTRNGEA